jgi:hypothetical protein
MRKVMKSGKFEWNEKCATGFNAIKQFFIKDILEFGYFNDDPKRKTILYVDASPYQVGAKLVQETGDGEFFLIGVASKALSDTEKRYEQAQREALAFVFGCMRYEYYLLGRKFTIRTDAEGIAKIFDQKSLLSEKRSTNKIIGYALQLSNFNYNIEVVEGLKI